MQWQVPEQSTSAPMLEVSPAGPLKWRNLYGVVCAGRLFNLDPWAGFRRRLPPERGCARRNGLGGQGGWARRVLRVPHPLHLLLRPLDVTNGVEPVHIAWGRHRCRAER